MSELLTIDESQVGYGQLGLAGQLGYECPETVDRAVPSGGVLYDELISAHAPSDLSVEITLPVQICGALSITAFCDPIRAYVDDHWIGTLGVACRATPWISLPPGRFTLRHRPTGTAHGAHTLWLARRDTSAPSDRVAVITHAYYSRSTIDATARFLFASAARHGVHVHTAGIDIPWEGFTRSKILRTAQAVASVDARYSQICVIDAADVLILSDEAELAERIGQHASIAAEPCAWPLRESDWQSQFTGPTPLRFPNSGVIAGPREVIQKLYSIAVQIVADLQSRKLGGIFDKYGHWWKDDQFVWQCVRLLHPEMLACDHYNRLSVCLGCIGGPMTEHPLCRAEGRRIVSQFGTRPPILHVCGPWHKNRGLWFQRLLG